MDVDISQYRKEYERKSRDIRAKITQLRLKLISEQNVIKLKELMNDDELMNTESKETIFKLRNLAEEIAKLSQQMDANKKLGQLRKKTKSKTADTKASKGRSIRYVAIPELANFFPMMPEVVSWTDDKRLDLIKSLFS